MIGLQQQQYALSHYSVQVDISFALDVAGADGNILLLFTAGEDPALGVLQPDIHVILEAEMEKSDHLGCPGRVFDLLRDERRDLLDNIYQGHRWPPIFLLFRDDVQEEVSSVRKRGRGKLSKGNRKQLTLVRVVIRGG